MQTRNLFEDIKLLLGREPATIADVGCHHGRTTIQYLERFPDSRVYGFEANAQNFAHAKKALNPYGERVSLRCVAVSDAAGVGNLNINTANATHSLLPIGDVRYWGINAKTASVESVPTVRLDDTIDGALDLLHMDIQGGEMKALLGAARLLSEHSIALIYCEVEFYELYEGQPLFWDIGRHLHNLGYHFYSLYGVRHLKTNPRVVSWADALFASKTLLEIPHVERIGIEPIQPNVPG